MADDEDNSVLAGLPFALSDVVANRSAVLDSMRAMHVLSNGEWFVGLENFDTLRYGEFAEKHCRSRHV